MSGAVAFKKLEQLADPVNLDSVIRKLNFGQTGAYDSRSCAMNNTAIIKTLTNQQIPATDQASALSGMKMLNVPNGQNGEHTAAVMSRLGKSAIVSFSLKFMQDSNGRGDHYFSAFQLDGQTVVAAMGWQNLYDFSDYFRHNHQGRFDKGNFEKLMRQMEDGKLEGVAGLCSFLGETRQGTKIPNEITDALAANVKPSFKGTFYFDLPGR